MNSAHRGFTLIELMIVVMIIAILAGVGYPSYREFVRRSARSEAKTALLENAQFMEQNFTTANRYDKDSAGEDIDDADLPVPQSPKDGAAKYTISVVVDEDTPGTYLLKATPVAGGPAADDKCGTFTLNNTGQKELEDSTANVAECWSK